MILFNFILVIYSNQYDFTRQLLSLKECLKGSKIKTIKELSQYFLENYLSSVYSDIVSALPVTYLSIYFNKNYLTNTLYMYLKITTCYYNSNL